MNKLDSFLASAKRPILMAHVMAGYRTLEESEAAAAALARGGAGILEIQIPFSDPVADGPSIVEASHAALTNGTSVPQTIELVQRIASANDVPVIIMTYANIVFQYGIDRFVKDAKGAGACGIILPDLPIDSMEGISFADACRHEDVHAILVVTPGVPEERLKDILKQSSGFIYCTSRQGITGATGIFASDLRDFFKTLKKASKLPIAIGFGVKSAEDFRELGKLADIISVGSFFVNTIKNTPDKATDALEEAARSLVK